MRHTLVKAERLHSRKLIELLFGGKKRALSAYPVRMVMMMRPRAETDVPVQMMVSVSKRHFKRAVKRNRVKRQLREAYRLQKQLLTAHVPEETTVVCAFIWLSDDLFPTATVMQQMKSLLVRASEKIDKSPQAKGE